MNPETLLITALGVALWAGLHAPRAHAANIAVTNVALAYAGTGQQFVKCDVSWDASWRASWTETNSLATFTNCANWDAAWLFVKYRLNGSTSAWSHASLSANNTDHVATPGSTIRSA